MNKNVNMKKSVIYTCSISSSNLWICKYKVTMILLIIQVIHLLRYHVFPESSHDNSHIEPDVA